MGSRTFVGGSFNNVVNLYILNKVWTWPSETREAPGGEQIVVLVFLSLSVDTISSSHTASKLKFPSSFRQENGGTPEQCH